MSAEHRRLTHIRSFWSRHGGKTLVVAIVLMGIMTALRLPRAFAILARAGFYGDVPNIFHDLVPRWFAGLPVYAYSYLAVHPPATYALLWPVFGPLDINTARGVWIALSIAAIGALVFIAVRESLADSAGERLFAALMPLCMYATFFTVRSGQFGILLLPLLFGALTMLKQHAPSWKRDTAAATLLLLALVKPTFAAPFMWIALFFPGGLRPMSLAAFGYLALTLLALAFQPMDFATLFREWQERSHALASSAGNANLHRTMARFALDRWLLPLSFTALAVLGYWTYRNRNADLWLLLGVAAIFARFWTYHRDYDDVLILLPAIALLRLAKRADGGVDVFAGVLLALIIATWLVPVRLLNSASYHFIIARPMTLLWLSTMIFLAWQTRRKELRLQDTAAPEPDIQAAF